MTVLKNRDSGIARSMQPTAEAYFDHVPKAQSLAVARALAPESVARLGRLKNHELAAEVATIAQAAGWLPPLWSGTVPDCDPPV